MEIIITRGAFELFIFNDGDGPEIANGGRERLDKNQPPNPIAVPVAKPALRKRRLVTFSPTGTPF